MKVIIMRGVPGAGKSTWVKNNATDASICSADSFLYNENGIYEWTPARVGEAHHQCIRRFQACLENVDPLIVVDNCNLRARDFRHYVIAAQEHGYEVEIRTIVVGNAKEACDRGQHGVPFEKYGLLFERMRNPLPADLAKLEVKSGSGPVES